MPIKPENRARYPKDWKHVRERILKRANWRCEHEGCRARHGVTGYWRKGLFHRLPDSLWDAGYTAGDAVRCNNGELLNIIKIVLTIAHLGLPAHLPVHAHVTRSTEADEVLEIVGFLMPCEPEAPEWMHMMHRRTLAEFARGASAVSARFAISIPGQESSALPGGPIALQPFSMPPKHVVLTDWRLTSEPLETTRIAAEASTGAEIVPADMERLSATFTDAYAERTFRSTHGFVATGRRASLDVVGGLLGRQAEHLPADAAVALSRTLSGSSHQHGTLIAFGEFPENCADENLRAWCQRHHLAYDAEHHKATAYRTRRERANTVEMF